MMARALILAALSSSPTVIMRPLISRDSELMRDGLRALGVDIEESATQWRVVPAMIHQVGSQGLSQLSSPSDLDPNTDRSGATSPQRSASIDVGNAGTVMRFLPPVAAMSQGVFRFDGDERSHDRPIAPVIKALEDLGVRVEHDGRYALPMTIFGAGQLRGGELEIDASLSSQFVSSLLLVAPFMKEGLTLHHVGASLPSLPHIEMTVSMLRDHGFTVETSYENSESHEGSAWWKVDPISSATARLGDKSRIESSGHIGDHIIEIEPDLSNAAPFLAAALLVGGKVTIKDWPVKTTQPGDALRSIFAKMGGTFTWSDDGLVISATGKRSDIKGIDIDLSGEGELTPTIALLAAFASTPSRLRGIGHLRLHETDRLSALATELRKVGAKIEEGPDYLSITPAEELPVGPITISTYDDHRIATLGALVGLMIPMTHVENIATTRKTITDFPALWSELLGAK